MSATHPTAVRNALADLVVDRLDAGSGPGVLVFQTAGGASVATLTLSKPAFGDAALGVATSFPIGDDTNAVGGTIAKAVLRDSDGNDVFYCTVTATDGGGDVELSGVDVGATQTVIVTSINYAASP